MNVFTSKYFLLLLFSFSFHFSDVFGQDDKNQIDLEKPTLEIGGALRFNYNYSTWKDGQKKRGGDFGYDVFRLNVKAAYEGVKLNAEYRLYSNSFGGGMLKQGWLAYDFNDQNEIQIGLTQVPFGITQYNSHCWFFSIDYYVGLEDDHDMGVKFQHEDEVWDYSIAFFKNAEELNFGSNSDISFSRYSYDVSSIDANGDGNLQFRNKEVNQLNGKLLYKFGGMDYAQKIGVSAEFGGLYNLDTENMGNHYAFAVHHELDAGKIDTKAQIAYYKYNPDGPAGESDQVIAMAAYGAAYFVAAEATIYTLGIGYSIPVDWKPISKIVLYNDFGFMDKTQSDFEDSYMNVTGALLTAGQVYTYIDFAAGKNHPWLGPVWEAALAEGTPGSGWDMRFNINLGYYF
ncbi:hypothetical protein V6R21_22770 [Limibacter armeniacum]|uniref:hypothetical protein n=1 Tax=Limibacter armeniacum TaxID=466084 RepID=UPI002FE628DB